MLMLSHYSDHAVAAIGVSNQILIMVIVMFVFVSQGTAIIVVQHLGANDDKNASEVTVTALSVNFIFGLLPSAGLFIFGKSILQLMDIPENLQGQALDYLQIVGRLLFAQSLIMAASASLRSYGFTKDAMYVTLGMNVLNVLCNYLLIFGPLGFPSLGVTGVAISTSVSRTLGFIVLVMVLIKRAEQPLPFSKLFTFQKNHVRSLLKIGVPAAAEQVALSI